MLFYSQNAGPFPPHEVLDSKSLPFPVVEMNALPIIPERHNPHSLRAWCRRLKIEMTRHLKRCPACLNAYRHA